MEDSSSKSRKHCGKRGSCFLRAISPFPTVFSKKLVDLLLTSKNQSLFGKGLTLSQTTNFRLFQTEGIYRR